MKLKRKNMNTKNQMDIFIVDDNKVFSLALKADIEAAFPKMLIKTHLFETGEKCMEKFIQVMPEVIILDYFLNSKYPEAADGIKVLDWIKKENFNTEIIMLTNDDSIDIALKSFHHGASDYVVKTETKFKKINYSLFNLFKTIEARSEAKTFKRLLIALSLVVAILVGGIIAIEIFIPSLFK